MSPVIRPVIRPAEPKDAVAIAAIAAPFARETTITFTSEPKSAEQIAAALAQYPWRVCCDGAGAVCGYAGLSEFRSGPGYGRVREVSIGLAPGARGQGQGRALMDALCEVAAADGVAALIAGISGENPAAIRFHGACGFRHVGRLPGVGWKFGRSLDLVLMQKDLSPSDGPG